MVCEKCGTEVIRGGKFCLKCGEEIVTSKNITVSEATEYKLSNKEIEQLSKIFVSRDEKYIASLGNSYLANYITCRSVQKGFAFLSNKRVYFKGTYLSGSGDNLVKSNEERTVDIKNITSSGFMTQTNLGGLFTFLGSLIQRKTYFSIEYEGGRIAFDVSFYAKAEIENFQRQLRRAKDLAEETETIRTVTKETPINVSQQNNALDDLRKYADLMKEGLISQEEYDAVKKRILGL